MKLTDLRGILQYVPQFREKTFILAVDGGVVADENFANILLDIAVLRSLNIRVVVVHGAAEQVKALAEKQGVQASDLDGPGVTDAVTLELRRRDRPYDAYGEGRKIDSSVLSEVVRIRLVTGVSPAWNPAIWPSRSVGVAH